MKELKLNLGCGIKCPDGWVNIDSSFGVYLSKKPLLSKILYVVVPKFLGVLPTTSWPKNTTWMDLTKPFKFPENSVDYIYSSHTFEHFTYEESTFVLSECYKVLKPGGVLRIIVPDFESVVNKYFENKVTDPTVAARKFHVNSGFFEIPVPNSFFPLIKFYFQKKNNHAFMYDEEGLKFQIKNAGFIDMVRKGYNDSLIPEVVKVERKSRFENAICIEAIKPV